MKNPSGKQQTLFEQSKNLRLNLYPNLHFVNPYYGSYCFGVTHFENFFGKDSPRL
jgi:hypothetical protein